MGLKEVKNELLSKDKEELLKQILELYKKYDIVKEYFDFYVNPNEDELYKRYKEKVREGFYPKRGDQFKLSISRKAINDFRKLETSKERLGELILYFVECGVEFTNDFGDINESFYLSIENAFDDSLKLLAGDNVLEKYKERANKVVDDTDGIGWGFHDSITDIFYDYYE
jgi:hypothetical protein